MTEIAQSEPKSLWAVAPVFGATTREVYPRTCATSMSDVVGVGATVAVGTKCSFAPLSNEVRRAAPPSRRHIQLKDTLHEEPIRVSRQWPSTKADTGGFFAAAMMVAEQPKMSGLHGVGSLQTEALTHQIENGQTFSVLCIGHVARLHWPQLALLCVFRDLVDACASAENASGNGSDRCRLPGRWGASGTAGVATQFAFEIVARGGSGRNVDGIDHRCADSWSIEAIGVQRGEGTAAMQLDW